MASSSDDLFAYRSTHPDVLEALAGYDTEWDAYKAAVKTVLAESGAGECRIWGTLNGWRPGEFLGIDVPPGQWPPHGWTKGRNGDYAVPDRRTAVGKRAAAALKELKHPGDPRRRLPGMPPDVLDGDGWSSCGLSRDLSAGTVYVTWRTCPEGKESFTGHGGVDFGIWERCPLSTYYAAREAAEAAPEPAKAGAPS
jgi:hypothetical protein